VDFVEKKKEMRFCGCSWIGVEGGVEVLGVKELLSVKF
jgi:hypothetical protein